MGRWFSGYLSGGVVMVVLATYALAQPAPPAAPPRASDDAGAGLEALNPDESSKRSCDMYISETSPRDVLIFDQAGKYLTDVRQIYLWVHIGMRPPQAKLYRYIGVYKPSEVKPETWTVRGIQLVSDTEFQQLVDKAAAGVAP